MATATPRAAATPAGGEPPAGSPNRTLWSDLAKLRGDAASLAREAEQMLHAAVALEPYLATAAAFGIGFLFGGGLPRGAASLLAGAGLRLAAARIGDEILDRAPAGNDGSYEEEPE